jgi:hypothetical protein
MKREKFLQGQIIFREGDHSTDAYRILAGKIAISIDNQGQPFRLAELGPDTIFGEMAMIDDKPRSATARATEDAELEVITADEFNRQLLEDPKTLLPYLSCFFERLREANNRLRLEVRRRMGAGRATEVPAVDAPPFSRPWISTGTEETEAGPPPTQLRLVAEPSCASMVNPPEIEVTKFPLLLGRQSTGAELFGKLHVSIRNDKPYQVSRHHAAIEQEAAGFFVRDRGSTLGSWVNEIPIGLDVGSAAAPLERGENLLILGREDSPFRFKIMVS